MTREEIAALALQGMLANPKNSETVYIDLVALAVRFADQLKEALKRKP